MEPIVCTLKSIKDVTKRSINGTGPPPRGWILRERFVFLLLVKSIEKKFQIKKRTRRNDHLRVNNVIFNSEWKLFYLKLIS